MNNANIPTSILLAAARRSSSHRIAEKNGIGDYPETFIEQVRPATSMPLPPGPADFPIQQGAAAAPTTVMGWLEKIYALGSRLLEEMIKQNTPSRPTIRATAVTAAGQTLTWEAVGVMDRLMIRNKGPNSCWYSYDQNGPSVTPSTGDGSFELQANESVNVTHCLYQKIGVICAAGQTATVHAQGFQSVAGNNGAAIS